MKITWHELSIAVNRFYLGPFDEEKARVLFKVHTGIEVEIIEGELIYINENVLTKYSAPEYINNESLRYLYHLQNAGAVNMFESGNYAMNALNLNRKEAETLVRFYITNYSEIYHPEELI